MLFFVKYALINFRSPNQYTITIDLLSIRISIRITSIRISKQSKHRDQQAKGQRESALSCIKKYALCCNVYAKQTNKQEHLNRIWLQETFGTFHPKQEVYIKYVNKTHFRKKENKAVIKYSILDIMEVYDEENENTSLFLDCPVLTGYTDWRSMIQYIAAQKGVYTRGP